MISLLQIRKHSSTASFRSDDIEDDDPNDRAERLQSGAIKFSTYKAFFKAARNNVYVIIVFIVFVAGQIAWSSADCFLSAW